MSAVNVVARAPKLAVTKAEGAAMLSMSTDSFERYVQSHVKAIRRGRLVLFEVEELRAWCRDSAERVIPE
jgi:hypothetical protein